MRRALLSFFIAPLLAALALTSGRPAHATASPVTLTTWNFVGVCTDCVGTGVGTLVIQNYVDGALLTPSNFVSFDYASSIITTPIHKVSSDLQSIFGFLTAVPGNDAVDIVFTGSPGTEIFASNGGFWCVGASCNNDFGPSNTFTTTAAVPEPASLALLGLGLIALPAARRRRRRRAG